MKNTNVHNIKSLIKQEVERLLVKEDILDYVKTANQQQLKRKEDSLDNEEHIEFSNMLKLVMQIVAHRIQKLKELKDQLQILNTIKDSLGENNKVIFHGDENFVKTVELQKKLPTLLKKIAEIELEKIPLVSLQEDFDKIIKESIGIQQQFIDDCKSDLLTETLTLKTIAGLSIGMTAGLTVIFDVMKDLVYELKLSDRLPVIEFLDDVNLLISVIGQPFGHVSDDVIDDETSYNIYKIAWSMGLKGTKDFINKNDYLENKHQIKTKIEHIIYKVFLLNHLIDVIIGLLHGFAGLLRIGNQQVKMTQRQEVPGVLTQILSKATKTR